MSVFTKQLLLAFLLVLSPFCSVAEEASPYPRVSEEGFQARLPFFEYDKDIPLEVRVVQEWDEVDTLRQKIIFRGVRGFLVPGFLEIPKAAPKPAPLVLLLHGYTGSKENWYEDGNYSNGGEMRKALISAGYAVLALDAAAHGERSGEIGCQRESPLADPKAPADANFSTFSEVMFQTVKDYRRALDYLEQRQEVDMNRIGLIGYSMGAMDSFLLLSVEPRIKMAVACVPPLAAEKFGPTKPIDYTWGIKGKPFLLLMGRKDTCNDPAKAEASYHAYVEGPDTKLIWYDQEHRLTQIYVPDAFEWIKKHL